MAENLNFNVAPEKFRKTFFQKAGGIALTGGLGALIGMGQRHADKLKAAKAGVQQSLENIGKMELDPATSKAYAQSQAIANQGMGEASKQMAIQENARGVNALLGFAGGRRAALSMLPGLAIGSGDFATRLAAQDDMQRRKNQQLGIEAGMQFGQQKLGLQQYKNEGLYNYYTGKQNQLNQTLTSALTAAGSLASAGIGAAGQAGSFGKLFKK
jgi:hypothetical protein